MWIELRTLVVVKSLLYLMNLYIVFCTSKPMSKPNRPMFQCKEQKWDSLQKPQISFESFDVSMKMSLLFYFNYSFIFRLPLPLFGQKVFAQLLFILSSFLSLSLPKQWLDYFHSMNSAVSICLQHAWNAFAKKPFGKQKTYETILNHWTQDPKLNILPKKKQFVHIAFVHWTLNI